MKQIRIKNFQAQRDLTIDLSPGITTIVGETDCGKSSTLRAIEWALTNKSRKNITTWGQDETVVTVVTGDNEISRIKNKKKNVYSVNGMEFAALRQDVPPEIEKLLNVAPESIQSQFSDIFWFTLTGGELVKKLNRIVNLDIIDFSFSQLNAMQNNIRSTITVYEDRLQVKEKELKKFEKLKSLREKLDATKSIQEKIAKTSEELKNLGGLIQKAHKVSSLIEQGDAVVKNAEEFKELAKSVFEERDSIKRLSSLISTYKKVKTVKAPNIPPELIKEIGELFAELRESKTDAKKIKNLIQSYYSINKELQRLTELLKKTEQKWKILMDGKCPLCGRGKSMQEHLDECCVYYTPEMEIQK